MIAVIICLLIMLGLQVLTPFWWWIMIVPFAYGVAAARSGARALSIGFISAGLLWLGSCLYFYFTGSRIIAGRISRMIGLGKPGLVILAASLVAALAAAISGYAGYAVQRLFHKSDSKA
jgi:energy-coupling factor transporter transmembrane protein EcfT